jgi:hypothetical protein
MVGDRLAFFCDGFPKMIRRGADMGVFDKEKLKVMFGCGLW